MIIGIGTDIIDIRRIEKVINRFGDKFKKKCFSKDEIIKSDNVFNSTNSYAKKYAAKEACSKALGTGFFRGVYKKDIEILNSIYGKPIIILHNEALNKFKKISKFECSIAVSISDEKNYAVANVIIFKKC